MRSDRRQFIKAAGVATTAGLAGLAGCSGTGGNGNGGGTENGGGETTPTGTATNGGTTGGDEPVSFKIGHGLAAEEPLWLMDAKSDMLNHWGDAYEAEFVQFDGNTPRLQAFQAGEIQAGTITSITSFFAVSRGLPLTIVASITQETAEKYATPFVGKTDTTFALEKSALDGKSIGICDFQASCHMWAASAAQKVGLTPGEDVDLVRVPFPTMGSAVAEGRVDAATMHQPFDAMAMNKHDVEVKFDAVDVLGYDHDLLEVWFSTQFLNRNEEAVRKFLADYQIAVDYYQKNTKDARGTIAEAGFVQTPKEVYVNLPPMAVSARPLTDSLDKLNQRAVELGWIDKKVDPKLLYNLEYLPEEA